MKHLALVFLISMMPLTAQSPSSPVSAPPSYVALTGEQRFAWFTHATYGPRSLLVSGPFSAAMRTYSNRPEEWGPHWEGFGRRYSARLLNNTVTNGLEASLGAVWNEDPRYFRKGQGPVAARLREVLKQTVGSRYGDGNYRFGAAKAIGIAGGAFSQKLWMPDSVTSNRDCAFRIGGNYAGRLLGNLFREFGPGLKKRAKSSSH